MNLNHNKPESMLRRISGLSDIEWNILVTETELGLHLNNTSFLLELIRFCLTQPKFGYILKLLGISPRNTFEQVISETNMEHTQFRFYRHFCPENIRNGISHAGLPFAKLVNNGNSYQWISTVNFDYDGLVEELNNAGFVGGMPITVFLSGINDINTIEMKQGNVSYLFYNRLERSNFGNKMWKLKNMIRIKK